MTRNIPRRRLFWAGRASGSRLKAARPSRRPRCCQSWPGRRCRGRRSARRRRDRRPPGCISKWRFHRPAGLQDVDQQARSVRPTFPRTASALRTRDLDRPGHPARSPRTRVSAPACEVRAVDHGERQRGLFHWPPPAVAGGTAQEVRFGAGLPLGHHGQHDRRGIGDASHFVDGRRAGPGLEHFR